MASACVFPEELITKPLSYVALTGLDTQNNAIHRSIWDTFTTNRRQEKLLNIQLLPGDADFPKRKQKQRTSYEFYIPKGILKCNWMSKHLNNVPALVVVFYDLDWNDQQWKEKQTECASRVAVIRISLQDRSTKIAVVLIQKNMPLPPGEDPQAVQRAEALCQACQLPSKLLFVIPFSDNLQGYISRLEGAFCDIAHSHYAAEVRFVKQHKELLNKSQHQQLFVRHQFKIGFYNELKQDAPVALKHYKQAYQYILEQRLTDVNNLEVKVVAGFLSYKICRISFQKQQPLDAITQFRKHIDYFKGKVGCSELAFEHAAWMAKQFSLFGDLFQEAIKSGLQAIQTQHPGFYYQQAANHTMMRRGQCKTLCVSSVPVGSESLVNISNLEFFGQRSWRQGCQAAEVPDPVTEHLGIQSLQSEENKVEHCSIVIPLLSSAVAQFREYKSVRMKLYLMVQMGEEYYNAKDYSKALTLLNRVSPFYRGEKWWLLLTNVLRTAISCAYLTANVQDYVTFCLELLSNNFNLEADEKTKVQMNLMRVVKQMIPEPDSKCCQASIEKAKDLWKVELEAGKQNDQKLAINLESLASFVECRPSFEFDSFKLDEVVVIKVYLRSVAAYPIRFSELGLQFSNPAHNTECRKTDNNDGATQSTGDSDLYLEPGKVKVHTFKLVLSPADLNQKLEIKQIYLSLGAKFVLRWNGAGLDANIAPHYDSYNYGGERLPVKYGKDGNILWESVTISPFTNILPREAKVDFFISHNQPLLVDEYYRFEINIKNLETTPIYNTRLVVKLITDEQDTIISKTDSTITSALFLDEADGGSNAQTGLKQIEFDLSSIQPAEMVKNVVFAKTTEMGKKIISFKTIYNLTVLVGNKQVEVDCVCSKEETIVIDTQLPFSITATIANMQFQPAQKVIENNPFLIMIYINCTSPWPIHILDTKFILTKDYCLADECFISQVKNLNLKNSENAGECQCLIATTQKNPENNFSELLPTAEPIRSSQIGYYLIKWKRSSGGATVETLSDLPICRIDSSLFRLKINIPSFGCVQEPLLVDFIIINCTNFVQEVEAHIEQSEVFMLAGNSQIQLRILPQDEHKLTFNLFPLYSGELLLPKLHINLPQHRNFSPDSFTQSNLPKYIFVKPLQTANSLSNEIHVV